MIFKEERLEHVENCQCDQDELKKVVGKNLTWKGRFLYSDDEEVICSVDSFGFRGPVLGEHEDCYQAFVKRANEATEDMYD